MSTRIIYYFLLGGSLLLLGSCTKYLEVKPPVDQLNAEDVFANDASATSALRGLYNEMMINPTLLNFVSGGVTLNAALSADELENTTEDNNYGPFAINTIPVNSSIVLNNLWSSAYRHIYHANDLIEKSEKSNSLSLAARNLVIGEAKFIRALCHFYLTNLFGPVPLITSTDYRKNAVVTRSDTSIIYEQIVKDLKDAQTLLGTSYSSMEKVRANKWAATALLARVYLYSKDWVRAEAEASLVIHSGMFAFSSLNHVFLANSSEAILQLKPVGTIGYNTAEGFIFNPASASTRPSYTLTHHLLAAFEAGDQRKVNWVKSSENNGIMYHYPYKYKVRSSSTKSEYNMVLRLSEQYLIRAEALARQGKLTDAVNDLDSIRFRAGLPLIKVLNPLISKEELLLAIEQERQVELFSEWGHRWLDLKRTGRANAVLGVRKAPNWQPTAVLFPIPNNEILTNPNLTQNEGY